MRSANNTLSSSSSSSSSSPRHPPSARANYTHRASRSVAGLLTPVSSHASLSPRPPAFISDGRIQPSPASLLATPPQTKHRRSPYAHHLAHHRSASAAVEFAYYPGLTPAPPPPGSPASRVHRQPSYGPRPPLLLRETHLPRRALPAASDALYLMSGVSASRASSPQGRARALSPTRPTISRPPSRCESLLRDTLRKDDFERHSIRASEWSAASGATASAPGVPIPKNRRSRGRSVLGVRSTNTTFDAQNRPPLPLPYATADAEFFDEVRSSTFSSANGRGATDILYRSSSSASQNAGHARLARGLPIGSPPEVPNHYLPYGSPASPTPMPPSMLRTRTAPAVPRTSATSKGDTGVLDVGSPYDAGSTSTRPSPRSPARHTLPTMGHLSSSSQPSGFMAGASGSTASSDSSSPKIRPHSLSPHEAVLRAKLESVLRAGSTSPEERGPVSHKSPPSAGRTRHHHRAHTHGVTLQQGTQLLPDDPASISPQAFSTYSLSNSASDIARYNAAYRTPSFRRHENENESTTSSGSGSGRGRAAHTHAPQAYSQHSQSHPPHPQQRNNTGSSNTSSNTRNSKSSGAYSPASPDEPLTPPSTPPFDAWTASEMCKRVDGYVSFANVEGLGEPPGLESAMEGEEGDGVEGLRRWGRWLKMLPFVHGSEASGGGSSPPASGGHSRSESQQAHAVAAGAC